MWNVIANLFVKAHLDTSLAAELLDTSTSSFVDMITVPPGEFLRHVGNMMMITMMMKLVLSSSRMLCYHDCAFYCCILSRILQFLA